MFFLALGENMNELSDSSMLVLALVKNFVLGVAFSSKFFKSTFFCYSLNSSYRMNSPSSEVTECGSFSIWKA